MERPSECRSYLVDPLFPKRADAKAAVCLVAMSQGVGDYIRGITDELENKVSMEIRQRVLEGIQPLLQTEYSKIWPIKHPSIYDYTRDKDGTSLPRSVRPSLISVVLLSVWLQHDFEAER